MGTVCESKVWIRTDRFGVEHHMGFDAPGPLPYLITTRQALAEGFTERELRTARKAKDIVTIRRGAHLRTVDFDKLDSLAQHAVLARATAAASSPDAAVSHVSAAVLHGLDIWNLPLAKVHLTANRTNGGKHTRRRILHGTPFAEHEVVMIDGVRVTSVARTVVDIARTAPLEQAVCIGDSARAMGLSARDLDAALVDAHHRKGINAALRATALMTDRAESVGETRTRLLFRAAGLPEPLLNQWIRTPSGVYVARTDFLFVQCRVISEFDGDGKYTKYLGPGQTERDAVIAEKKREDRVRDLGWTMARISWSDLSTPDVVAHRLREAFARAALLPPPRGTWSDIRE